MKHERENKRKREGKKEIHECTKIFCDISVCTYTVGENISKVTEAERNRGAEKRQ